MRRQLKDQPLPIQFLVAGGIVAVFSIVSLILLLVQVSRQEQASRWLGHSHRTVGRLSTLGTDYYRQRTLLLDYLKSLDEKQLANLHERRQLWTEGFQATQALVSDDTEQVEYLGHLAASYDTWIKLSDELLSRAKKGQPIPFEKLRTESGDFKEAFLIIDAMINAQNSLLNRRDHQQRDAISTTFTAIAAINIALLLIFGVVLTRLYFQIARPIAELSRGMARYQGGDFTARVRVSNRSEIGFLEAAFNEMAEKIEGMVGDLRKLDELKTEFLSTVSHELRTPLTSIGGYVKLLAAGDAGPVTGTQKEFLDIVDTNVVRLTHLINDILDVEKMESGKIQLIKEPQDLGSILKEVRDTFGIVAQQKGLELRYSVPERLVPIQGDRMRLVQLFMNLVSNAIKYTKHGFVSMEVEEHDFAIVVRIRDSGVGLTADEQEKLFQKFYRARSGLKSGEGGTGLGLVIVRGLVESHGGTIRVESDVGVGTTFTVSFPVAQNVMRSAPATRAEGLLPLLPPIPIWIVDQSASDSERLRTLLDRAKATLPDVVFEVRVFGSLREVPDSVTPESAPRLVILDPQGAGGGGDYSAISLLRKKIRRSVPVLVVSSASDPASAFAEGASGWLTKPIDEREFQIAFKDLLHARGWKVLLAEPNTDVRLLMKRALEQRGIHVDDTDHGGQVLSRIESEEYDLALIEMDFPDISGKELLKAIRRSAKSRGLPVIVLHESDRRTLDDDELRRLGADHSVGKNRGIAGIVDKVFQFLEERKSR